MSPHTIFMISCAVFLLVGVSFAVLNGRYRLDKIDTYVMRLKKPKDSKDIPWESIKAVYNPTKNHKVLRFMTVTTVDGNEYDFMIDDKNTREISDDIYNNLLNCLSKRDLELESIDFQHADRWARRKAKILKTMPVILVLLILVLAFRFYQIGFNISDPTLPVGGILFAVGLIYLYVTKGRRVIKSLHIKDSIITLETDSDPLKQYNLNNLKHIEVNKFYGELTFQDGTTLSDLAKLCYWPLLHEYLLSQIK